MRIKTLHWTAISLRSIATGKLGRSIISVINLHNISLTSVIA